MKSGQLNFTCLLVLVVFLYLHNGNGCTRDGIDGNRIGNLRVTSDERLLAGQLLRQEDFYEYEDMILVDNITIDATTGAIHKGELPLGVTIVAPLQEDKLPVTSCDAFANLQSPPCGISFGHNTTSIWWVANGKNTTLELHVPIKTDRWLQQDAKFLADNALQRGFLFYYTSDGCRTAIIDFDTQTLTSDQLLSSWEECPVFPDAHLLGYNAGTQVLVFDEFCGQDRIYFHVNESSVQYLWKSDGRGTKTHLLNAVVLGETPQDNVAFVVDHHSESCEEFPYTHIVRYILKKVMLASGDVVREMELHLDDLQQAQNHDEHHACDPAKSSQQQAGGTASLFFCFTAATTWLFL